MRRISLLALSSLLTLATLLLLGSPALAAEGSDIQRMPNGKPDLSGVYDAGTVTPVDRPPQFGDKLYLTPEEARELEKTSAEFWRNLEESKGGGADREAPQQGATATIDSVAAVWAATTLSGSIRAPRPSWSTGSSALPSSPSPPMVEGLR